ncbi:MAG: glycosyltransferase family 4 protein [Pseudomonadota bacterium]
MTLARVAFYAPIKPPDHPIASGDREIARLLVRALERAGHDVWLASKCIAYVKRADEADFQNKKIRAQAEVSRILDALEADTQKPDVWMTYHPYCKAPDWIGPDVCRALQIPYTTVEACHSSQKDHPVWDKGRARVREVVNMATTNFCLKPTDRIYLESILHNKDTIFDLAPFIDLSEIRVSPGESVPFAFANGFPVLTAVGMMRPGKKQDCYDILARALERIADTPWNLVLIGDGPARQEIEDLFSFVPKDRIAITGALPRAQVLSSLARSDVFVWPGYREPIGMVYLEAAAVQVPVVALASMGVPMVVCNGETGILAPETDIDAFADGILRLVKDADLRASLGKNARLNVERRHDIGVAGKILSEEIQRIATTAPG